MCALVVVAACDDDPDFTPAPRPDATVPLDGAADAWLDGGDGGPGDAGDVRSDSSADSGSDGVDVPPDGPADGAPDSGTDAPADGPADASAEADGAVAPDAADAGADQTADVSPEGATDALEAGDAGADTVPLGPGITATEPRETKVQAPSPDGMVFAGNCREGQVLTGVTGSSGGVFPGVNAVTAQCATVKASGAELSFDPAVPVGPFGKTSPTSQLAACGPNQVVVGFEGRAGYWIDQLFVHCASLSLGLGDAGVTVVVGPPTRMPAAIGPPGGEAFPALSCSPGQIAVGILGATGETLDRFGLHCATPKFRP